MRVTVNPDGALPPYMQVANKLRDEIREGKFKTEDKLPSYPQLAKRFGVSLQPINNAIRVLREEGWVFTTQRGTFVRAGEPTTEPPSPDYAAVTEQLDSITGTITDLRDRLAKLEETVRRMQQPSESQSKT